MIYSLQNTHLTYKGVNLNVYPQHVCKIWGISNPSIERVEPVTSGRSLSASLGKWQALVQRETCLKVIKWKVREEAMGHPPLTYACTNMD